MTKEAILAEIKRTATENGGRALGRERFVKVTGIKPYDWARYWARWSGAVKEAGLTPNTLMASYDDNFLLEKLAALTQELGKFPTHNERRLNFPRAYARGISCFKPIPIGLLYGSFIPRPNGRGILSQY